MKVSINLGGVLLHEQLLSERLQLFDELGDPALLLGDVLGAEGPGEGGRRLVRLARVRVGHAARAGRRWRHAVRHAAAATTTYIQRQ